MPPYPESSETKSTYILVNDLGSKIESFRQLGFKTPNRNDPFVLEFQNELKELITQSLPNVNVLSIEMEELAMQIHAKSNEIRKTMAKNSIVVSSCLEISPPRRGITLEVNRIIDFDGQKIGIGPRPGFSSISEQVNWLKAMAQKDPVILVEDGSFSGRTMAYILKILRDAEINLIAVVMGIMFQKALAPIRRSYIGELFVVREIEHALEWMPDHDFFPFAPNCGKVVGVLNGADCYPFFNCEGASYAIPYVRPFSPMRDWATIPKEYENNISMYCLQKSYEFFTILEKMNNRKEIVISDLVGISPLVSIPMRLKQKSFPPISTSVRSFLHEACNELL